MENIKIKKLKNSVGRKPYIPDTKLLKKLYVEIKKGNMTNEEGWKIAGCKKTKWFELKKQLEVKV